MRFEINDRIITKKTEEELFAILTEHFKKISEDIQVADKKISATNIETWDIGAMNKSETVISLKAIDGGWLAVAEVKYDGTFWILVLAIACWGVLSFVGLAIPAIVFYLQKMSLKKSITSCFQRFKNEVA